jgi:hypothetical protein
MTLGAHAAERGEPRLGWPAAGSAPLRLLESDDEPVEADPGTVLLTCANCGAAMDERKCKLICRCGYFLSCSDYY